MKTEEIQKLREDYSKSSLDIKDVESDPIIQFQIWLDEAMESKIPEPNAMSLATVDGKGIPHNRIVLLKGIEKGRFVFYSNYLSDKGKEISGNQNVAICFLWKELERQVRIEGKATKMSRSESEEYFKTRPVKSQIGALASEQSSEIHDRQILEDRFEELNQKYADGNVPMPENWGGYLIKPDSLEFWQGRRSRLHDRIKFIQAGDKWNIKRLSP